MRLSQLARKISVSQTEIIAFLKRRGISHKGGGNTKMDQDHVALVIEYFMPELLEKNEITDENIIEESEHEIQERQKEELISEIQEEEKSFPETEPGDDIAEGEKIEVIRAKKIQLDGLKVVGKIELPEKQKKPNKKNPAEEIEIEAVKVEKKVVNNTSHSNKHSRKKSKYHSTDNGRKKSRDETYEEKIIRLEKEKRKINKERQKKIREKKKQHYLKTVQNNPASNTKPKKEKKQSEITTSEDVNTIDKKSYKNPIRKLWAWLSGEYDDF